MADNAQTPTPTGAITGATQYESLAEDLGVTSSELNTAYLVLSRIINSQQVGSGTQLNPQLSAGQSIPSVSNLKSTNAGVLSGSTQVIATWNDVASSDVHGYNVFYQTGTAGTAITDPPHMITSVPNSPAIFTIPPTTNTVIVVTVQTVMQSGSVLDLSLCPTATLAASSPNIVPADLNLTQLINGQFPLFVNATWTNNSPAGGFVAWSSVTVAYKGVVYAVTSGNFNSDIVTWALSSPNSFTSRSLPYVTGSDEFIVAQNVAGFYHAVVSNQNYILTNATQSVVINNASGTKQMYFSDTSTGGNLELSSQGVIFRNALGNAIFILNSSGTPSQSTLQVISSDGSKSAALTGSNGKAFFELLQVNTDVGVDLENHTIYGASGASAGFIELVVNGTTYKLQIFNP